MTSYLKEGEAADKYKAGIPLGRFASAEEIANTCLFLASDMGAYITGQTISVCGGLNIWQTVDSQLLFNNNMVKVFEPLSFFTLISHL